MRLKAADLEKEMEVLKLQRQDLFREIAKLKDLNESRVREAADQSDRLKGLDYDMSRVTLRSLIESACRAFIPGGGLSQWSASVCGSNVSKPGIRRNREMFAVGK